MARTTKAPKPCEICQAPSVDRPGKALVLCAECAVLARDAANQKVRTIVSVIRSMKVERNEEAA